MPDFLFNFGMPTQSKTPWQQHSHNCISILEVCKAKALVIQPPSSQLVVGDPENAVLSRKEKKREKERKRKRKYGDGATYLWREREREREERDKEF